jgi:hypothetical protein
VRLVFSGAVPSGEGSMAPAGAAMRGLSRSTGSTAFDEDAEAGTGTARAVVRALESVVEEQTTEISQICGCAAPVCVVAVTSVSGDPISHHIVETLYSHDT